MSRQVSNWIWFPLIQRELDTFVERQNSHRIRKQNDVALPSGGRPDEFYNNPQLYGGDQCLIPVDRHEVDELLADSEDGELKLRYVDEDFEPLAEAAYEAIGRPEISLTTGWTVFRGMVQQMTDNGNIGST